ncbi:MAG: hypothetical protein AAF514_15070, partial [Verrucomicrobiota bacterium]
SGRMAGEVSSGMSKFELAVIGIRRLETDWEPLVGLGLQVTDRSKRGTCAARAMVPAQSFPDGPKKLSEAIKGLYPRGGQGSIHSHLKTVLAGAQGSSPSILLFTDEISDCANEASLPALLAVLAGSPELIVHIIDLGASDSEAIPMKTLTETSGGIFATVTSLEEMEGAVQAIRTFEYSRHNVEITTVIPQGDSDEAVKKNLQWKLYCQSNKDGKATPVLTSRGPGFRAILPTGAYFLEGTHGETCITSSLFVPATGRLERKLSTSNGEATLQPVVHGVDGRKTVIQDQALNYKILRKVPGGPSVTVESRPGVAGAQTFSLPRGIYEVELSGASGRHSFSFSIPGDRKHLYSLELPTPILSQVSGEG